MSNCVSLKITTRSQKPSPSRRRAVIDRRITPNDGYGHNDSI